MLYFLLHLASFIIAVSAQNNGDVRLVGGTTASQGRVEVFLNGTWGTVCDDGWDLSEGDVVCRQLGYVNASLVTVSAYNGQGSGPIHLSGLECKGNETNLINCPVRLRIRACGHDDDAGVICWPPSHNNSGGLSTGVVAAIVFIPFLLLITIIIIIIVLLLYFTLTYDKDAKEKEEFQYQERRFLKGLLLKDQKKRKVRSRRKSTDSYISERNIPRDSLGEGMAHPWQEDENADSEIGETEIFQITADKEDTEYQVKDPDNTGEVRQRIVSAINPMVIKLESEIESETKANPEESNKIPDRYKKKLIMSDEEIDEEFNFSLDDDDDDDDDINPYETVDPYQ